MMYLYAIKVALLATCLMLTGCVSPGNFSCEQPDVRPISCNGRLPSGNP